MYFFLCILYFLAFFLCVFSSVVVCLVISNSVINRVEKLISEMPCYVSAHSLVIS